MVNAVFIVKASQLGLSHPFIWNSTAVVLPINVCLRQRKRGEQGKDRRYGYAHWWFPLTPSPLQSLMLPLCRQSINDEQAGPIAKLPELVRKN
jgi:hypothetical protein